MSRANLLLTLGKVIIAAAWADGEVSHEEVNALKDLLFRLPDLTGREWASLEMYIEAPVGAAERARLVEQLKEALSSPSDKELALSALEELIQADGVVTDRERAVAGEIREEIASVDVSIIGKLGGLLRGPLERRTETVGDAPNREAFFEDFIKNRVFYEVRRRLSTQATEIDLPERDLRKLSLAGGLMAWVAHVDREVTEDEFERMATALQSGWSLDLEAAEFVASVAVSVVHGDLDYYRLTREFFTSTDETERQDFLDVLFEVARADGFVSNEEIEEIRMIARSLKLTHRQFIEAKLKIPRDLRAT